MSFDGSFVLESALERFLSRHPNLRSAPVLAALSQKAGVLTAEELVSAIADPFLHPSYTIPIMGYLRPLAQKIVRRAVSKLGMVPSLVSESKESEEEIGEDDIHVIDFYVGRGRGLRLHELASLAFCRALDLALFLLKPYLTLISSGLKGQSQSPMDGYPHVHAPPSSWPCLWEGIEVPQTDEMEAEHLKQALLRTTLELESTRLVAQEELKKLEAQYLHLAHLLQIATKQRNDARLHCHSLLLSNSLPHQDPNPNPNPYLKDSSNAAEEEEEESSKVSSPAAVRERGLPERGRQVKAAMRAGPLLQTVLLAGPLPQWRHPSPAMQSFEIPLVSIGGCGNSNHNDEKQGKREEEGRLQSPPNLNPTRSSSPESNGSSKYHNNHNHNQQQQFGCFLA